MCVADQRAAAGDALTCQKPMAAATIRRRGASAAVSYSDRMSVGELITLLVSRCF
jgi:hypothetical protein